MDFPNTAGSEISTQIDLRIERLSAVVTATGLEGEAEGSRIALHMTGAVDEDLELIQTLSQRAGRQLEQEHLVIPAGDVPMARILVVQDESDSLFPDTRRS